MKLILSLILFITLTFAIPVHIHAFDMPQPLSQEEQNRLRQIGEENARKYGVGGPTSVPLPQPTFTPTPTFTPMPTPTMAPSPIPTLTPVQTLQKSLWQWLLQLLKQIGGEK